MPGEAAFPTPGELPFEVLEPSCREGVPLFVLGDSDVVDGNAEGGNGNTVVVVLARCRGGGVS